MYSVITFDFKIKISPILKRIQVFFIVYKNLDFPVISLVIHGKTFDS